MEHLKQRISRIYYNHGLFCATHPTQLILCVCVVFLLLCFPLFQLPLIKHVPIDHLVVHERDLPTSQDSNLLFTHGNPNKSLGYSLQLVLHSESVVKEAVTTTRSAADGGGCLPHTTARQVLLDSLQQSAKIVQIIQQFRSFNEQPDATTNGDRSFEDICFQIEDRIMLHASIADSTLFSRLPTFGCLLLAPSMLWENELGQLQLSDVSHFDKRFAEVKRDNLRDLFFGLPWQLTGIKQRFVCDRPYSLAFVISLVFREYDQLFIDNLRSHLSSHFPSTPNLPPDLNTDPAPAEQQQSINDTDTDPKLTPSNNRVYLVWYRGRSYLSDYAPLLLVYLVLLLYVYFSVCKLEMVKSKWGLAFSACCTVVASLCMSLSLCIRIGLVVPTLNGGEIFPYLVVLIGFENAIILTKSVVATPIDLPVKYRIAQGLSKESWPMTKHYLTQLLLLGLGFFTFHPTMQEFCLFAVVGVTTDFFLQLFFFVTVLSIDIRRIETSDITSQYGSDFAALTDAKSFPFADVYVPTSMGGGSADVSCGSASGVIWWNSSSSLSHTLISHGLLVPLIQRISLRLHYIWSVCKAFAQFCWSKLQRSSYHVPIPRPGHKRRVSAAEAAAFLSSDEKPTANVPRRLWLLRILAKHRVIQRLFIFIVALWIILIGAYTIYMAQRATQKDSTPAVPHTSSANVESNSDPSARSPEISDQSSIDQTSSSSDSSIDQMMRRLETSGLVTDLRSTTAQNHSPTHLSWDVDVLWNYLAFSQWPLLALYYNLTLAECHLAILEPIHLYHQFVSSSSVQDDSEHQIHDSSMMVEKNDAAALPSLQSDQTFLWNRVSQMSWDKFWPVRFSWQPPPAAEPNNAALDLKHNGERFVGFADEFLQTLATDRPLPLLPSPPGGAASWNVRLWLTASMMGTSLVGCSFVLLATCLGMVCFQELQSKSSVQTHREPVIRVLPLTISLSEDDDESSSVDASDPLMDKNTFEWTLACGNSASTPDHEPDGAVTGGIIAACGLRCSTIDSRFASTSTNIIQLWSTNSGLALPSIHRYSASAMTVRRSASVFLHRLCRRRSTVWTLCFLPDGLLAAGCSDGAVEVWNCQSAQLQYLLFVQDQKLASEQNATTSVDCPPSHPGGITTHLVVSDQSFVVGTSRGSVAWFDISICETIAFPTRQWSVHSRSITQLLHTHLTVPTSGDKPFVLSLVVSGAEDGYVSIIQLKSEEPLYRLSLDPTAVVSFDISHLFLASSHASGSLYSLQFAATLTDDKQTVFKLETIEAATQLAGSSKHFQPKSIIPYGHLGSVGLKWFPTPNAIRMRTDGCLVPSVHEFRLVSCELEGYIAVWSLDPVSLIRTFRMNLSTISPSNPTVHFDNRVVFGDQGYLRVVNPWTAKYERSVHLLPPSTAVFRNESNHLSSNILSSVLRKWSKQLIPLGIAGRDPANSLPIISSASSELCGSNGSFMVSVADCGRTLVIVPLTTVKPL